VVPLRLRISCAALAAFLALSPLAQAASRLPIVVLPYAPFPGVSPKDAAKLGELLGRDLRGRDELRVLELRPEPLHPQAYDALGEAHKAVAKSGELAKHGKHAQAAEQLQRAISLLSAKPVAIDEEGGRLLSDAALQLAVERLESGDEDGGDAALAQFVRVSPGHQVTNANYPPAFVAELASVRKRLLEEPRGTLRILLPPGAGEARALFDGRPLPPLPVEIKETVPGEHFVRVERAGAVWATRVVIIAGATTNVAPLPGVEGPDAALQGQLLQGEVDRAAVMTAGRLARDAGAQAAIFGAVVRSGDSLRVKSFLALAKGDRLVTLSTLEIDRELLGSMAQVVKLGDDAVAKLASLPAEPPLPIAIGGDSPSDLRTIAGAPPAPAESEMPALSLAPLVAPATVPLAPLVPPPAAKLARAPVPVAHEEPPPPALTTSSQHPADEAKPAAKPPPPTTPPTAVPREALLSEETKAPPPPKAKSSHTALWIAAGVLVVGGLATGGYLLWEANRTPSTATVTATWGH
jgi:hypothetical protein